MVVGPSSAYPDDNIFLFSSVRGACRLSDSRLGSRTLVDVLPVLYRLYIILLCALADLRVWYELILHTKRNGHSFIGKWDVNTQEHYGLVKLM